MKIGISVLLLSVSLTTLGQDPPKNDPLASLKNSFVKFLGASAVLGLDTRALSADMKSFITDFEAGKNVEAERGVALQKAVTHVMHHGRDEDRLSTAGNLLIIGIDLAFTERAAKSIQERRAKSKELTGEVKVLLPQFL